MQKSMHAYGLLLFASVAFSGCAKKDSATPASTSTEAYIQVDDKKNKPVTQKVNPSNDGKLFSSYFATTSLDMTTKVGSNAAIVQTLLIYQIEGKSNAEIELAAKAMIDGIAEGQTITAKILGDNSRVITPIPGFIYGGSVSAGTGAWDFSYSGVDDVEIKLTKSGGKLKMVVASPFPINAIKRGGAGDPAFPSFTSTTLFTLQIPL